MMEEKPMYKIMVIDDDAEVIENITMILKGEDISVEARETTQGAVEELKAVKPDLLILDVMFPESPAGGFDLAREIRETKELKDLPIILLTAINQELPMDFSSKDIDDEWMPVQKLMEKPVHLAELREAVKELLKK
ncbi:MAG: response regulator [Spirochaetales bacterium]|nr:MAG: response regulator [Spirochaetales bacterium]